MDTEIDLLVAGRHALYGVNVTTHERECLHEGGNLYFALTCDGEQWYFGFNRGGQSRMGRMNKSLEPLDSAPVEGGAANQHGAIWYDGKIYWTMPGRDSVYIDDERWIPSEETPQEWQERTDGTFRERIGRFWKGKRIHRSPDEIGWDGPGSMNLHHYNSIYVDAEGILISAHNRGNSEVMVFDHERNLVDRYLSGSVAHTIWRHDGKVFIIDSGNGLIKSGQDVVYDANTDRFPRGIAFDGNHYYLGLSERRRRNDRDGGVGVIRVLTENWKYVKDIEVDNCGQIHEIRLLKPDPVTHNGLSLL